MKKIKAFSLMELSIVILIIGVLIAATTQGAKIVDRSRLNSARLTTTSSGADNIPNMVFWIESTLEESITSSTNSLQPENNDSVSGWKDLNPSEIKNSLTASGSAMPLYKTNSINNLPAINFDGNNDYFQLNNLVGYNFTAFYVIRTSSTGIGDGTGLAWQASIILSADKPFLYKDVIPLSISAGKLKIGIGNVSSGGSGSTSYEAVTTTSSTVNDNKPHIIVSSRNKSNGVRSIYIDGTLDVSNATSDGNNDDITGNRDDSATMSIGFSSSSFDGYIGELIIYDRILNQVERKSVERYLGKKWGVRVS